MYRSSRYGQLNIGGTMPEKTAASQILNEVNRLLEQPITYIVAFWLLFK